jgi:hypothetical protein
VCVCVFSFHLLCTCQCPGVCAGGGIALIGYIIVSVA